MALGRGDFQFPASRMLVLIVHVGPANITRFDQRPTQSTVLLSRNKLSETEIAICTNYDSGNGLGGHHESNETNRSFPRRRPWVTFFRAVYLNVLNFVDVKSRPHNVFDTFQAPLTGVIAPTEKICKQQITKKRFFHFTR